MRDSLAAGDSASLLRLADDPDLGGRGAVGLWLLGHSLEIAGSHDRALEVLRRAQRSYPNDYWLNTELGLASPASFGKSGWKREMLVDHAYHHLVAAFRYGSVKMNAVPMWL